LATEQDAGQDRRTATVPMVLSEHKRSGYSARPHSDLTVSWVSRLCAAALIESSAPGLAIFRKHGHGSERSTEQNFQAFHGTGKAALGPPFWRGSRFATPLVSAADVQMGRAVRIIVVPCGPFDHQ